MQQNTNNINGKAVFLKNYFYYIINYVFIVLSVLAIMYGIQSLINIVILKVIVIIVAVSINIIITIYIVLEMLSKIVVCDDMITIVNPIANKETQINIDKITKIEEKKTALHRRMLFSFLIIFIQTQEGDSYYIGPIFEHNAFIQLIQSKLKKTVTSAEFYN